MPNGASAASRRGLRSLALIAGTGELPRWAARHARGRGARVVACALPAAGVEEGLRPLVDELRTVHPARWGELVGQLARWAVEDVVLVGKFPRTLLFSGPSPDDAARVLLGRAGARGDDPLVAAFVTDLEARGFRVLSQLEVLPLAPAGRGVLAGRPPTGREGEIAYGFRLARAVAGLDIGQTVVVKGGACVAVEAACGTDATIRRGGHLAGPGACVVKVSKPEQDYRLDLPTVGRETLAAMADAGADLLAVEAGRVYVLPGEELYREAEAAGITVVGVEPETAGGGGARADHAGGR